MCSGLFGGGDGRRDHFRLRRQIFLVSILTQSSQGGKELLVIQPALGVEKFFRLNAFSEGMGIQPPYPVVLLFSLGLGPKKMVLTEVSTGVLWSGDVHTSRTL